MESNCFHPVVKYLDVASNEEAKKKMRKLTKDPNAEPPHFACGDEYLGVKGNFYNSCFKIIDHFRICRCRFLQ